MYNAVIVIKVVTLFSALLIGTFREPALVGPDTNHCQAGDISSMEVPSGVKLIIGEKSKSYSPVSLPKENSYMDLLVKPYPPTEGDHPPHTRTTIPPSSLGTARVLGPVSCAYDCLTCWFLLPCRGWFRGSIMQPESGGKSPDETQTSP